MWPNARTFGLVLLAKTTECYVSSSRERDSANASPVAADGIVFIPLRESFHTCSIAVGLQDHGRLCDSLIPLIRDSSRIPFGIRTPVVVLRKIQYLSLT